MLSLGINIGHDRGASLVKDGEIICTISQERLDRKKHSSGVTLPYEAMMYCMQAGEVIFSDLDVIVYNYPHHFKAYAVEDTIRRELLTYCPRVEFIPHHLAHAYSTFYASPFEEAVVFILDGAGNAHKGIALEYWKKNNINFPVKSNEIEAETAYYFSNENVETIYKRWQTRDGKNQKLSLGRMYWEACLRNGMGLLDGGKLMGMAPYGEKLIEPFSIIDRNNETFDFDIDISKIKSMPNDRFDNQAKIAWITQYNLEETLVWLTQSLYKKKPCKNICIAGGVGLNSVSNERMIKESKFENIFILPASNDTGIVLGCAYYGYYKVLGGKKRVPYKMYTGKKYSDETIKKTLANVDYTKSDNISKDVAKFLVEGKIIGWYQGASEYGPRALGNRSILCDPRKKENKDILNHRVKHREDYRPFAPAVIYEEAHKFFTVKEECPYMLRIVDVLEDKKECLGAIAHVDGTARVQTVKREQNINYYDLIKEFGNLTGVPVILNTSFNVAGEPVVETPMEALNCFLNTQIDILIINDYIIKKGK